MRRVNVGAKGLDVWRKTVEASPVVLSRVMANFNVVPPKRNLLVNCFKSQKISLFTLCPLFSLSLGWEDPSEVDSTRGHRLQKVHFGQ